MIARVLFYEWDKSHTAFYRSGMTPVLTPRDALEVYANTPNPASQLIKARNITELWIKVLDTDRLMADPNYVKQEILPTL